MTSNTHQSFLLSLARDSIKTFLTTQNYLKIPEKEIPPDLLKKHGTFVTLTINKHLRGCIGHIEPIKPICEDIIENAVAAAFFDPRFSPLTAQEFDHIKIEISLLSIPEKLKYKDSKDLLSILAKIKPGLIIEKGPYKATFLPQVWEELKKPEDFLSYLCQKAGLSSFVWQSENLDIKTYNAKAFSDE